MRDADVHVTGHGGEPVGTGQIQWSCDWLTAIKHIVLTCTPILVTLASLSTSEYVVARAEQGMCPFQTLCMTR